MHQTLECGLLDGRVSGNDGNHSVGQDPALLFTDDLMLDLGRLGRWIHFWLRKWGFRKCKICPGKLSSHKGKLVIIQGCIEGGADISCRLVTEMPL